MTVWHLAMAWHAGVHHPSLPLSRQAPFLSLRRRTSTEKHRVILMQREAPHAAVRHTSVRRNILHARVVRCDAPRCHVPIEHEEVAACEAEDQRMRDRQEHSAVNVLKVKPAERELLGSPVGASCLLAGSSGRPSWQCLTLMLLLPPQLAVFLAPGDECGGRGIVDVGVPGGTKDLQPDACSTCWT